MLDKCCKQPRNMTSVPERSKAKATQNQLIFLNVGYNEAAGGVRVSHGKGPKP